MASQKNIGKKSPAKLLTQRAQGLVGAGKRPAKGPAAGKKTSGKKATKATDTNVLKSKRKIKDWAVPQVTTRRRRFRPGSMSSSPLYTKPTDRQKPGHSSRSVASRGQPIFSSSRARSIASSVRLPPITRSTYASRERPSGPYRKLPKPTWWATSRVSTVAYQKPTRTCKRLTRTRYEPLRNPRQACHHPGEGQRTRQASAGLLRPNVLYSRCKPAVIIQPE